MLDWLQGDLTGCRDPLAGICQHVPTQNAAAANKEELIQWRTANPLLPICRWLHSTNLLPETRE